MARGPVAVDDEARINLVNQAGVEARRQAPGERQGADVPGDVQIERGLGKTESAERRGDGASCVIADEDNGRSGA